MSTTAPSYTGGQATIIASGALAASGTTNANWDISTKFGGWVHVNNTPGGSVSATRGLKIEVFRRYGATPTTAASSVILFTLPSATASTLESLDFFLEGPGIYNIKLTNLDAAQGLTVEVIGDTFNSLSTT